MRIGYDRLAQHALLAAMSALCIGCAALPPSRGAAGRRAPDAGCAAALSRAHTALAAGGAAAAADDPAGAARVATAHAEHAAAMADYHACLARTNAQ